MLESRCPRCQQVEAVRVCTLTQAVVDQWGKVSERVVGYRLACQKCPNVYSFGATGAFQHDARSQPLTPEVPPTYDAEAAPAADAPPRAAAPVPKRAPRV